MIEYVIRKTHFLMFWNPLKKLEEKGLCIGIRSTKATTKLAEPNFILTRLLSQPPLSGGSMKISTVRILMWFSALINLQMSIYEKRVWTISSMLQMPLIEEKPIRTLDLVGMQLPAAYLLQDCKLVKMTTRTYFFD